MSFSGESLSLVEGVMLCEVYYWKKVKCSWHNLFMSAYFNDPLYKRNIGVLFVKNYKAMFSAFLEDDKVRDFSYCIISLTVQLFTVPSISVVLMTEYNALQIIFQQFIDFYSKYVKDSGGICKIQNLKSNTTMHKQRTRVNHVLYDARYILSNIPEEISPATEDAFLKFLELFVKFTSYMQEMNTHVRESGQHILREKEWDQYFLLEISEIRQIMPTVARWCTATPRLLHKSLEVLIKVQHENVIRYPVEESTRVTTYPSLSSLVRHLGGGSSTAAWEQEHKLTDPQIFRHKPQYVLHDMFRDPVSFHLPVTRLFALVFSSFHKFTQPSRAIFGGLEPANLLDTPLRSILLSQQIEANMWKRNGTTMENQSSCYRDHYKSIMWDKDLLALQLLLSQCQPDDALLRIVRKYKIEAYFVLLKSETCNYDPLIRMAEAFSSLLLYSLGERYRLNISEASEADILRKDAIHILAIAAVPRSKIIKTLEQNFDNFEEGITKTDEVDEILGKIADKASTGDGGQTMLKLKPEFYNEFTPFYYHYSHGQRQSAENRYYQTHAPASNNDYIYKPPTLPKYTKFTAHLRLYFVSPVIQRFIYVVLKRYTRSATPILVSDLLLHQVTYLIMFGLLDESTTPDEPLPTKFSTNLARTDNPDYLVPETDPDSVTGLLNKLLSLDSKSVNELKPVIRWCLQTCEFLTSGVSTSISVCPDEVRKPREKKASDRKEMLRRRREQLMANFHSEQSKFIADNAETFGSIGDDSVLDEDEDMELDETTSFVACGPNKGPVPRPENLTLICILCKDSEKVNTGYSTMMYGCLIEKSVVLKMEKHDEISEEYRVGSLVGGADLHIQSCGHPMHLACLQSTIKLSPAVRNFLAGDGSDRRRLMTMGLPRGEFSCPYCKMVANCALPVVGYDSRSIPDIPTEDFLTDVRSKLESTDDIELMEFQPESPTASTPPYSALIGLEHYTEATSFIEMLRDTVINNQLNRLTDELPDEPPEPEELEPSAKFKDDMRRFYRRAKNILNRDAVGAHCYAPYTLKMVSYTFSMLEYILREKPLMAGLAEYQEGFFESFLRSLYKSMSICDHLYTQELARELLYLFSPQSSASVEIPSILNTDVFTIFVASRFAVYTEGKCYDNALVEMCVLAEVFKILISIEPDEVMGADASASDGDAIQLATVWGFVRRLCGYCATDELYPCPTFLVSRVKQELLPFLRKLALFLRYATSIPGCNALKEMQSPEGEFVLLMAYLNIQSLSSLLNFEEGSQKMDIINKWCSTIERERFTKTVKIKKTKREAKLIDLPNSFVDLLVKASQYTCPKIKFGKIQTTAVCLICGDFVCFQSYCCQETVGDSNFGPCNLHAHRCSGDLGIFLTPEKCQVLLLPVRTQGVTIQGPYVDKYGETYKTAKNKALQLSPAAYKKIETMWIKHEIRPLVVRTYEGVSFDRMAQTGLLY